MGRTRAARAAAPQAIEIARAAPHVLREYAFLGDGERGIVVGPRGDFSWMCFPRWDSDAIFSSLIGGAGTYAVTPRERYVWGGHYETDSLIWRSRWVTAANGVIECREALALPACPDRAVVLRRVTAVRGTARVQVCLQPAARFGRAPLRDLARDDAGTWRGRAGDIYVAWSGAADARQTGGSGDASLELELELEEGDAHDLVLVLASEEGIGLSSPSLAWPETASAWRARVPAVDGTAAPRDAGHAYAVLSGLTSSGGGMVAAATLSLPERARAGRNYDYRYVWIRDQCYAGRAVAKLGPHPLLDDAVRFVRDRLLADGSELRPAYTVTGGAVPDERTLDLEGYPGGSDVVGNWVNQQFQLDALGESLLLFAAAAGHDHLGADEWRAAEAAIAAIEARWHDPDAGIWELEPDEWTHSRLICAAGLRAISRVSPNDGNAARWLALADAITADSSAHCVHRSGRWQRSPTDSRLDVALLLPALRGALPADDPRSLATLSAVARELTQDGYVYRFRHDARPLGDAEGAFLLCGFILSLAYAQQGDAVAAVRWFERNRAACGPPGLLSRSSMSNSASCVGTCRRPSCTRCCSSARPSSRA